MRTSVLLSIKPIFATAIFCGDKKYEFRRTIFKNSDIKKVYVYASSPIGKVIGEFQIKKILSSDPESIWEATQSASGISKIFFDKYFNGKEVAHALEVSHAYYYEKPITLKKMFNIDRPPQSFMYV